MLYTVRKRAEGSAERGSGERGEREEKGEIIAEQAVVGRRPRSYYEVFMTSPEMSEGRSSKREADCIQAGITLVIALHFYYTL